MKERIKNNFINAVERGKTGEETERSDDSQKAK